MADLIAKLSAVTPPATEPVSLVEAKAHLRVDIDTDDSLISTQISAARAWCEDWVKRAFVTQTWRAYFDVFPGQAIAEQTYCDAMLGRSPSAERLAIVLPKPPLVSVTHVKYYDEDDALQTLASTEYQVDTAALPGRILPKLDGSWPATSGRVNAVEVQFVCGGSTIDPRVKQAILLIVGSWYETREDDHVDPQVERAAGRLLSQLWPGR